jgi:putative membrane protein
MTINILPHINAMLNATSGILLLTGYFMIRRHKIRAHRACMIGAISVSVLFLISYVVYHLNGGLTRFAGVGLARTVYLTILGTHTTLAVLIVPFVILTARRAIKGDFIRHKRVARWTFPAWLYVSVTGVIVYLMLYHLYPSRP